MKYPYIGQCYSAFVLFYGDGEGLVLGDALGLDENTKVGDKVKLNGGTNITAEHLRNTKIRLESPEHSEFVQLLAEIAGYRRNVGGATAVREFDKAEWIYFCDEFFMSTHQPFTHIEYKEIFLPLPPECEKSTVSGYDSDEIKEGKDWLVNGCTCSFNGKDYYYVGKSPFASDGAILTEIDSEEYEFICVNIDDIEKPKTPEQIMQENLINIYESSLDGGHFVDNLLSEYTLIKKPQ